MHSVIKAFYFYLISTIFVSDCWTSLIQSDTIWIYITIMHIGDHERQLLETLDSIKVVRQAYHGNVFIGNHCKIILNNYEKLCSVVSDEPEFHEL